MIAVDKPQAQQLIRQYQQPLAALLVAVLAAVSVLITLSQ